MLKRLSHVCLGTLDLERAIAFYRTALGCAVVHEFRNDHNELYGAMLFCRGGTFLELFRDAEPMADGGRFRHLCFEVEDIETAAERFRSLGHACTVRRGRTDRTLQFFIHDPDGTVVEFHQHDAESKLSPWLTAAS